jgi:hypothetical protein
MKKLSSVNILGDLTVDQATTLLGNINLSGTSTGFSVDYYERVINDGGYVESLFSVANAFGDNGNLFSNGYVFANNIYSTSNASIGGLLDVGGDLTVDQAAILSGTVNIGGIGAGAYASVLVRSASNQMLYRSYADFVNDISTSINIGSYVPITRTLTINGTTYDLSANRTFTISTISGNAGTATTLENARTITIGSTGKIFNGSANVSWSLAEIGALGVSDTAADSNKLGGIVASSYALLASPALIGTPTAPTAPTATNNTQIATTAFVKAQGYLTSYTETDTLATVTARGSSTTNAITVGEISSDDGIFAGNINLNGTSTEFSVDYYKRVINDGGYVESLFSVADAFNDKGNLFSNGYVFANSVYSKSNVSVGGFLEVGGNASINGGLTVDTDTLVVDSVNNRVGIGTTTPDEVLHVNGNVKIDGLVTNGPVVASGGVLTAVLGYTGVVPIIGNPPGQQNLEFVNGILVNVF